LLVFTEGIATWWPAEHHILQVELADTVFEPRRAVTSMTAALACAGSLCASTAEPLTRPLRRVLCRNHRTAPGCPQRMPQAPRAPTPNRDGTH
jgi:hypothetical protein